MTHTAISHPAAATPAASGTSASYAGLGNWAGVVDRGSKINYVEGSWLVNHAASCYPCSGTVDQVGWVGIGGYTTGQLIQAGSREVSGSNPYVWYEYLKPGADTGIVYHNDIAADDNLYVQLHYTGSYTNFYAKDLTTGVVMISNEHHADTSYWDGTSAEWVFERPTICAPNYCYNALGNWNYTENMTGDFSTNGGSTLSSMSQSNSLQIVMNDNNGTTSNGCSNTNIVAYDNSLSGNSNQITWCRPY